MKNSSDTIGNRTRDLWTCSAVPHPTVLPRTPLVVELVVVVLVVKGKAIPLQASTDPEGSSGLRLPDFKTIGT